MRVLTVLDPGHGGNAAIGQSTPFGVAGPNSLYEKNVTLAIARGVAERLGSGVQLTRHGDVNVALADRARSARELGAGAFVSIHANGGVYGARGCETWVHPAAAHASLALAEELRGELGRLGVPDRGLYRGDMAVLKPGAHQPHTGACLVEVDYLDSPEGARRLADPRQLAALSDAIARAVERHHGKAHAPRAYSFGHRAVGLELDLTDFSDNAFVVIADGAPHNVPVNVTRAELDAVKSAWDNMMHGRGMALDGSADDCRAFRNMLLGGLVFSPQIRALFQEITNDAAHTITFKIGRSQPGIFVDAFQWPSPGNHTIDMDDFEQIPNVSGAPRNYLQLRYQVLVHALREARQGVLGNAYLPSHQRAIDDENSYRTEQGQIGAKDYAQPYLDGSDLRFDLNRAGTVILWEKWVMAGNSITSINYSPAI